MNTTKEIEITTKNSKLFSQRSAFDKRWNIQYNTENREQFKTRCLNILDDEFYKHFPDTGLFDERASYINDYCLEIAANMGIPTKANNFDNFANKDLYNYIKKLDLSDSQNYTTFMFFLQLTLGYNYGGYILNETLAIRFAEAMKLCNIKAKILNDSGSYDIYPSDTEFLDKPLIIDVLNWLNDFPDVKKNFSKALKTERTNNNYRNIVDDLRLSLELFLKKILNNNKALEKQKSYIGDYFKNNDVSTEISNMYIVLIDYYAKYNDNHAKHDDSVVEIEIDYLTYLTASFIRFIILTEEKKKNVLK